MTIVERVATRGIREILHFTTNSGALGTLVERALLPRALLEDSKTLEFILKHNCDVRKDPQWAGYNSMSITKINDSFFDYSRRRHSKHDDLWWCIFAFSPEILLHEGVVFVSGNNTWPSAIKLPGVEGFEHMFATRVPGTYGSSIPRPLTTPANVPTSLQAEVLYPGRVSLEYLMRAYFCERDHADQFLAQASALGVALSESIAVVDETRFRR